MHEKITHVTKEKGWNQAIVARKAGISATSLGEYIKKGTMPGADVAFRIARALGITLDSLMDESQEIVFLDANGGERRLSADQGRILGAVEVLGLKADDVIAVLRQVVKAGIPPEPANEPESSATAPKQRRLVSEEPVAAGEKLELWGGRDRPDKAAEMQKFVGEVKAKKVEEVEGQAKDKK